jgi:hypothetical protein
MFSKISRYRKLPDMVTIDVKGRALESKNLRLLPEVTGIFLHTVEEIDRLDHLAYKYYKQSRKWWRICDANPEFMSPQALLGKETVVTYRFPLTFSGNGSRPPWSDLLGQLAEIVGIESCYVSQEVELVQKEETIDGEEVTVYVERIEHSLIVTYNQTNLSTKDLSDLITDAGFEVVEPENIGRIGKNIIIPPDVVG